MNRLAEPALAPAHSSRQPGVVPPSGHHNFVASLPTLPPEPQAARPIKILILKPSSLGDVIQALPVLRLLKKHFPQGEIYWWIESGLAPLLERDPDLAGILRFNRRRWARPANWAGLWRDLRWARARKFDWVVDLQCLARSAAFGWLANGQSYVGLDGLREGARGFYDVVVPRPSADTHAVDWYLRALRVLGVPVHWDFEWLPANPEASLAVRRKWPVQGQRWIILQPGARWLNKRWPIESFSELVARFPFSRHDVRFAVLGASQDRALGAAIARIRPEKCLDLTGQLSLTEMLEWIRVSELMITNDTGPMHAAAAMRRPVLGLFGPTDPRRTGPYGQLDHTLQLSLPCVPCLRPRCHYFKPMECLRALSVELVLQKIEEHLGSSRRPGSPHGSPATS